MAKVECICATCGKSFFVIPSRQKIAKYCGHECARVGGIKTVDRECLVCGQKFKAQLHEVNEGHGKYCSLICTQAARRNKISRNCLFCGDSFETYLNVIEKGNGKFCSKTCANSARTEKVECVCLTCGEKFLRKPGYIKRGLGKYCSKKCKRKDATKLTSVTRECAYCKTPFSTYPNKNKAGHGKYCSKGCFHNDTRKRVERRCEACDLPFQVRPNSTRKFCSLSCAYSKLSGENSPHYRGGSIGGYRGPNWTTQRKLAYERDGRKCQHCGVIKNKNGRKCSVHHIVKYRFYKELYGRYGYLPANDLLNLITLCDTCHAKAEHGKIPIQRPLL